MWETDHQPEVGQTVTYWTIGQKGKKEGTITKIADPYIYIKSSAGRTISRATHMIHWPEKFPETAFSFALTVLQFYVPECWSEKRIDYYK